MKKLCFSFLTMLLALLPASLFAQAPSLGTCTSFVLFTPVGALNNTGGATTIVGNIGTNSGAISGYPTGSVVGQMHNANAVTAQAATDVQTAYNYLAALPCPTGPALAAAMGSNQTLSPGTYCQGAAASVGGQLILDGQNQANPLFIFKINGALTAGAGARVVLINGASASNVYWQVNGAVALAANTAFAGTIIASGAIAFGDGASLEGRGLSTVGTIATNNTRINSPGNSPPPVELVAPNLGVCASFALFTPVGTLINAGNSTAIVGDIGTNSGTISGYSTASMGGRMHNANVWTRRAATDVQAAYNYLAALPYPAQAGLAPAMGGSQILTPGIYYQGGAASVAGDLILDGQNRTNPLFIFKINGALTADAGARVVLRNGASPSKVYWQVNGAASFATNTAFAGTIIAYGAVAFGDGASLQGRGLSTVGAVATNNNQIISPNYVPLPVELATFTAQARGTTAVALAWGTASEKNSARFEVERSTNGTAFDRIGTVPAAGSSSTPLAYSWTDEDLPAQAALLYYRLRQVDTDGTFAYSPVRTAPRAPAAEAHLVAYPNPAHDFVRVQLPGPGLTEPLQLLDACGRTVRAYLTPGADGLLPLTGLPAGLYVLRWGPLAQRLTLE